MRRVSILLAVAAIVASGLSVTPAFAHEGRHEGDHGWRGQEWREQAWRRHQWREHRRWYSGYYNYNYNRYYSPPAYYGSPGVTFGFTFR